MSTQNVDMKNSQDKLKESLLNAENSFALNELKNQQDLIIFNEKMVNHTIIGSISKIDYQNQTCFIKQVKGNNICEKRFSFKPKGLETQIKGLQLNVNDLIAVKYLGKKMFNGNLSHSFVVKKWIEGLKDWITSKSYSDLVDIPEEEK